MASSHSRISPTFRVISALLVAAQILSPWQLRALAESGSKTASIPPVTAPSSLTPPPPVKATVNTKQPPVPAQVATISFSDNPTDDEFARCRLFDEPLLPIGGKTTAEENSSLAQAILGFAGVPDADHLDGLHGFLAVHPGSAWSVSLLTNLGIIERRGCYWSEALADWNKAWRLGRGEKEGTRKRIVDRALVQLAELTARIGRLNDLKALLGSVQNRQLSGSSTEKMSEVRQSLFLMETEPTKSFRCGPLAAGSVWAALHPEKPAPVQVFESQCTDHGTSLTQVRDFAKGLGLDLQIAKRSPGAEIVFPAIVHWKVGHFAALTKRFDSGLFAIKDPTFTDRFVASNEAIDKEGSGYFLVPSGDLPEGWEKVSDTEGKGVWGKGAGPASTVPTPSCTGPQVGGPCPTEDDDFDGSMGGCEADGIAGYHIDPSRVNLYISDTPLFYQPPHGSKVAFTITYSQRDVAPSSTPNYPNLGPQWNLNWVGFVVDDPSNSTTTTYGPGGGTLAYTGYTSTGANTGSFVQQSLTHTILERTSATSYVRHFPDGSKQIYGLADTSTPKKIYLTEYDNPVGDKVTFTYDPTTFRLLSITDSLLQVTTLGYVTDDPTTTNGDFYRVASVTDPFGRSANFTYDTSGRLAQSSDMGGITSQFTYGTGDIITTLTTPYGNTTFASNDVGSDRTLLVTDPEGGQEYVWFKYNMTPPDSADPVPSASGLLTTAVNNQYRTTYYWDKKAYMEGAGDFSKAHLYHFCHTPDLSGMSDILESEKRAFESRIYYNYPGQTAAYQSSNNNLPSKIARVMDDGTTQLQQFAYDAQGKTTKVVTPGNATTPSRTTTMTYAVNGWDLTAVYQENTVGQSVDSFGTAADLLSSFTYDAGGKHLVMSATDASGQTSSFTYNSYGQILSTTNAKSQTNTFAYDRDQDSDGTSDGYLTSVTGPVAGATLQLQYDGFGRLYQTTDSEGYAVTIGYDAAGGVATKTLNRVALITYPDGTTEQTLYDRMDPQWKKDRLGRWTELIHDNMRRLSVVVDPLSRITEYQWCACGSMEALIDPAGNRIRWSRDAQRRITQKTYADGTAIVYNYENRTSRLKSVIDAKGQRTNYQYNIDDSVGQLSYTDTTGNPLSPATPSVSFTYDGAYPRILTMLDGIGTTQCAYNGITTTPTLGAGRLATVDGPWANDTISYSYDELRRGLSRSINGATNASSVTYDTLGRIATATNVIGTFNYSYVNATSKISQISYPNGQVTNFQYFGNLGDQRLKEIKNQDNSANVISQFDYTYNAVGNILTWTQNNPTLTNPRQYTLGYDEGEQLTSGLLSDTVTSAILSDRSYRYDSAGNRVTTQSANAVITEQPNALNQLVQANGGGMMRFMGTVSKPSTVSVGGNPSTVNPDNSFAGFAQVDGSTTTRVHIVATDSSNNVTDNYVDVTPDLVGASSFSYDLNGNTIASGPAGAPNVTYGWDAANRLVTITQGSNVTKFDYDGQGRRVRESLNGIESRHWIWCGLKLCEERDASNIVTKRFYAGGEQISGVNYYCTRDHLGSVREMVDGSNVLHARYDYDLFGQSYGNLVAVNPVESDFGFTGHYYHTASGLCLAPYREYSASTGRWLSRDPLGEEGGVNLYAYVGGNPMNWMDSLGLLQNGGALLEELPEVAPEVIPFLPAIGLGTAAAVLGFGAGYVIGSGISWIIDQVPIASLPPAGPNPPNQGYSALTTPPPTTPAPSTSGAGAQKGPGGGNSICDPFLSSLPTGNQNHVKTVPDESAMQSLYDAMTAGGTQVPAGTYPGVVTQMPDGTMVRMRGKSKSGGSTIDVTRPDGSLIKVHVK